jgi:IclR family transcriptional regulator, acetate operon repressor
MAEWPAEEMAPAESAPSDIARPVSAEGSRTLAELSSIEKGLLLIRALAGSHDGMTLAEVASATGLNRSTIYRLSQILEKGGWVQASGSRDGPRRVAVGPTMLGLSILISNTYNTTARLQPVIDRLASSVLETVHVGVLEQREIVHIARAVPESRTPFVAEMGTRDAAHWTALGKALLSTMDPTDVRRLYPGETLPRRTPATLGSVTDLLADLGRIRERGYAVDDEESRPGVRCVAAPVFGPAGQMMFAVSVTSAPARLAGDQLDNVIEAVKGCAALLTTSFGGSASAGHRPAAVSK